MSLKLKVPTKTIRAAAKLVARATGQSLYGPLMETIHLEAVEGALRLRATDMSVTLFTEIPAEVAETGAFCAPAKNFVSILSALRGDEVQLKVAREKLAIASGKYKGRLAETMKGENYPDAPDVGEMEFIALPGLMRAGAIVLIAASKDEMRPSLMSILFERQEDGRMALVAADGYRLTQYVMDAKAPEDFSSALVDAASFAKLGKAFGADVEFCYDRISNRVMLRGKSADGTFLTASLTLNAGNFPDYKAIIPKGSPQNTATVGADELLASIKLLTIGEATSKYDVGGKTLTVKVGENRLTLEASGETYKASDEIPCETEGEAIVVGLGKTILADAVKSWKGEDLQMRFFGQLSPITFTADEGRCLEIVMPRRVEGEEE